MQIPKLKLVAFAVIKRLQGYRLLRNPESVSPLSVTMLKSRTGVGYDATIHNTYTRITKDFSQEEPKLKKEILFSDHYYPLKSGDKKDKFVYYADMATYEVKEKGRRLFDRPILLERTDEMYDIIEKQRYYSRFSSKLGRLFEELFGLTNVDYSKPLRPGFFETLRNNLKPKS